MGIIMIRISVLYFFIGTLMGIMIHAFPELRVVHPHWNLLGWVSLAISGLVYTVFPKAGSSRLGKVHFWLHTIGIPILLLGLFLSGMGLPAEPYAPIGGIFIVIGVLLFTINVFKYVNHSNLSLINKEATHEEVQK
jgi:cbb3-type cytochrome oxidase subunit 1